VRRWLIVAALFVVTYGISTPFAAYGVFLPVLAETFGWTRGAISTALSINLLVGGVAGFVIGTLADRHGPRVLLVVTAGLAGSGFTLVSAVTALWQLYVYVGVLSGIGMSSFYLLSTATVAHWFQERRGLGIALVLVGFSLGYISGGPLAAWFITHVGWRAAYALIGGGCGLMTVIAAFTVRLPNTVEHHVLHHGAPPPATAAVPPARIRAGLTLAEALSDPRLWYLAVAWLLLGGIAIMVSVHIVPFSRDHGISLEGASLTLTAYGVGSVSGRLAAGAVSDRLGTRTTVGVAYALQAIALTALLWTSSREALLAMLVLFGVGFAAADNMITKAIPDVFGVRALGAIMGVLTAGWRLGAAVGPAAAGFLYDAAGSYVPAFGAAPGAVVVSWTLFTLAASRTRLLARVRSPAR
jgi:predicted MFS family arabinose efflux permease